LLGRWKINPIPFVARSTCHAVAMRRRKITEAAIQTDDRQSGLQIPAAPKKSRKSVSLVYCGEWMQIECSAVAAMLHRVLTRGALGEHALPISDRAATA